MGEKLFSSVNPELFELYAFYVGILVLKYILMIVHVGLSRVYYRVPRNTEDGAPFGMKVITDENVERNRRAHQNDLENIPFFIIICFLYLLTDPPVIFTQWTIRIYVLSRIIYTYMYTVMKSIYRIPFFEIGLFTNFYFAACVIHHFSNRF